MGSKVFDGVRFSVHTRDHSPPHVHGTTAGAIVILDLLPNNEVSLSDRWDAVTPSNTPRNVQSKIRRVAAEHIEELYALWEKTHGTR